MTELISPKEKDTNKKILNCYFHFYFCTKNTCIEFPFDVLYLKSTSYVLLLSQSQE